MSDTERKGIEMSENAKWLREIANGTLVQAYDQADYLAASAMNDVLRGKFVSAADEIESLRARIAELEARNKQLELGYDQLRTGANRKIAELEALAKSKDVELYDKCQELAAMEARDREADDSPP